jgi:hypothetical protein
MNISLEEANYVILELIDNVDNVDNVDIKMGDKVFSFERAGKRLQIEIIGVINAMTFNWEMARCELAEPKGEFITIHTNFSIRHMTLEQFKRELIVAILTVDAL